MEEAKLERKQIGVIVFLVIAISFFSLLLISIITLNVIYCTLALVLLFTQSAVFSFLNVKVRGHEPPPARERLFYNVQLFGAALMLVSVVLASYNNSYIESFVQNPVFLMWMTGLFVASLGGIALRTHAVGFRFKKGAYPRDVEETIKEAKSVTLAPIDSRLNVDKRFTEFIKKRLIKQKLILRSGQKISLKIFPLPPDFIPFEILETDPVENVKVTKETIVKILSAPK